MALVRFAHLRVKALDAHLHLGASHAAKRRQVGGCYALGACLYHQADHAMGGVDVLAVLFFELFPGGRLLLGRLLPGFACTVQAVECLVVRAFACIDALLLFGDEFLQHAGVA